jgi:hypothetical protein
VTIKLQTVQNEGEAAYGSYGTAATLLTIPGGAVPWAKAVFRHLGTAGYWYGRYAGGTPTTSVYDFKLAAGEPHQLDNPPMGDVILLAGAGVDGNLSYSIGWAT